MENIRTKHNYFTVGSKFDMLCKKHPRHKQSPGVCSVCLGERLSQVTSNSSRKVANKVSAVSSCSSSSSLSSYNSSIDGSPVHHKYRLSSMKNAIMSDDLKGRREDLFRKSKSFTVEKLKEREGAEMKKKKKKNGYWSKLLRLIRRKNIKVRLASSKMITTRVH